MLRKISLSCLLFIATLNALADTPPIIDVRKMKAGTETGLIQSVNGVVSVFAPCPTVGYILKSTGSAWTCQADSGGGGGGAVDSVNGQTGTVVLTTDNISEGTKKYYSSSLFDASFAGKTTSDLVEGSQEYFTATRARNAAVADTINDGTTNVAPSQNAVFDALATKQGTGNYITALTGGVSASGPGSASATVNSVGGASAAAVATAVTDTQAATSSNTTGTIVKRDGSGNFSAGTITASLSGNATTATTANEASFVGGQSATEVSDSVTDTQNATAANSPSTIVKRDASGNFIAGTIQGTLNGTASNVSGVVAIANGGTGQSNAQAAINNLTNVAGSTVGYVLQHLAGNNAGFAPLVPPSPTGPASALSYYDYTTGILRDFPGWSAADDIRYGMTYNKRWDAPADGAGVIYPRAFNLFVNAETAADSTEFIPELAQMELQVDNERTNKNFAGTYGLIVAKSHNGGGVINYANAADIAEQYGDGTETGRTAGSNVLAIRGNVAANYTIGNGTHNNINSSMNIQGTGTGYISMFSNYVDGSGTVYDINGVGVSLNVANVSNNLSLGSFSSSANVGNNFNGSYWNMSGNVVGSGNMLGMRYEGSTIGGNFNFIDSNIPGTSSIAGDFRQLQMGNDGAVGAYAAGVLVTQNGSVGRGWVGYGAQLNGNMGTVAMGDNAIGVDISIGTDGPGDGIEEIKGNITGFNFNNDAKFDGDEYNFTGANISNGTNGAGYRYRGLGIYNQANMEEEQNGYSVNLQGNARTGTGGDIYMQGNYTDDVRGMRINVSGVTSTNQEVNSLETNGGKVNLQSQFFPKSGQNVQIGNGFFAQSEVTAGNPLTGTDTLHQLFQTNMLFNDNVSTGPFGLDQNAIGMISQVVVGSGVTVPLIRSLLVGTSVPMGSGGTITEHEVLVGVGLPSFGGTVTNPTRTFIKDGFNFLGQTFCNGATDCWGLKLQDPDFQSAMPRLALNTSAYKTSTNVRLELNDGHIRSTQTTAPSAAADANAGTGATCTVTSDSTDTRGTIQLTTGTLSWASGTQCTVTFNMSHNVAPKCTLTPNEGNAAMASLNVYKAQTTTALDLKFVNADVGANSYEWDYICIE